MLTFLLDTKAGHLGIGLLCVLLAAAGCYWRGHNAGWDSGVRSAQKIVSAQTATIVKLETALESDAATINQLRAANEQWARAAKGNAAEVAQAIALSKADETANARALAAAQARIHKIEASHGDAHAWSVTPVPAGVLDALRADRVH